MIQSGRTMSFEFVSVICIWKITDQSTDHRH